jgi:hypothetical protein
MGLALSPPLSPQQNTQLLDLVCEIKELQKQIKSLREMNTALEDKLAQKCETKTTSINKERPRLAKLSEKKINEFVKEILHLCSFKTPTFSAFLSHLLKLNDLKNISYYMLIMKNEVSSINI